MGNWTKVAVVGDPPLGVTIGTATYVELSPTRARVTITWTATAGVSGVHVYEEPVNQSSSGGVTLGGTVLLNGASNLGGQWQPVDMGKFLASPAVFETDFVGGETKRYYLNGYNETSEPELIRATEPGATPSITLAFTAVVYQSGVEYAWLVTGQTVTVEIDETQVSSPKYSLRFQLVAPTDPPAVWQSPYGGCQIVYEYADGRRANGPAFAVNELDVRSDWYDLYVGSNVIRCWFVSFDNSADPRINTIVEGVTPYADATVVWPLSTRAASAPYADNVTGFAVSNARYATNGAGQKELLIDWAWTVPATAAALARWGGSTLYLYLPSLTTAIQVSGAEMGSVGTMAFTNFPSASEVWVFAAISQDNNGNLNTDPNAPISGTPIAVITVDPPAAGAAGTEWTSNVTGASFAVSQVADSNGVTTPRITASYSAPADVTWGGAEFRVYDGATLIAKGSTAASPVAVTVPNPTTSTSYTVKLVSFDVNGRTNTETVGTPQGTVLVGSAAGTLDLRKFLPASTDNFTINGTFLQVKTGTAITIDGSGNLRVAASGIDASLIAAGAVGNAALINGSVDDLKLASAAVTSAKIAAGAVLTAAIGASQITTTTIADDAITTPKIIAGAITAAKIGAGEVTAGKIAALSIVAGDIAADAITATKILAGSITTVKIAAGAVTATEIAALAIVAGKIAANAVTATELAADAVTATKILAGSVTTAKVAANAISSDKLDATVINVGGGGSKPGQFAVYNSGGSQVGWIGTDSGNSGAWFKTLRIGGTSYSNGIVQADASGNVTIDGATLALNLNGVTTTVGNVLDNSDYVGLRVQRNSATGTRVLVTPDDIFMLDNGGGIPFYVTNNGTAGYLEVRHNSTSVICQIDPQNARVQLLNMELTVQNFIDTLDEYRVNGVRVVEGRKSAIGTSSTSHSTASFTDVDTALNALGTAINTIVSRLGATSGHGLTSD